MRPVERGPAPRSYAEYADAKADLFNRLGRYCSFCERPILASLAVEHLHYKDAHPHLEREWTNFLLACSNCNSTKGTKPVSRSLFLPDRDNTFRALVYSLGGIVSANPSLSPAMKAKATRLIRLVGLDRRPAFDPRASDMRWNDRRGAWKLAARSRAYYESGAISLGTLIDLCVTGGHWSIWMTVFAGLPVVLQEFINAIPGTAPGCFDLNCVPVARPGGQV